MQFDKDTLDNLTEEQILQFLDVDFYNVVKMNGKTLIHELCYFYDSCQQWEQDAKSYRRLDFSGFYMSPELLTKKESYRDKTEAGAKQCLTVLSKEELCREIRTLLRNCICMDMGKVESDTPTGHYFNLDARIAEKIIMNEQKEEDLDER